MSVTEHPDLAGIPPQSKGPSSRVIGIAVAAIVLLILAAVEFLPSTGALRDFLSFKTIGLNYGVLKQHVAEHYALSALLFVVGYGLLGLFLLPGSPVIVTLGGLLFGASVGFPLGWLGSALAASLGYATAKLAFGWTMSRFNHPAIENFRAGFQRHALSYMTFLRLTPGLSFVVINAASALIGVRFSTFLIGTVIGLLPSRIALSTAGAGLAKAIDAENAQYSQCLASQAASSAPCPYDIHVSSLLTGETIAAFCGLALLALSPALLDGGARVLKWRTQN